MFWISSPQFYGKIVNKLLSQILYLEHGLFIEIQIYKEKNIQKTQKYDNIKKQAFLLCDLDDLLTNF